MGQNQISPLAPFSGGTGPMYGSSGNPVLRPLTTQEEFGALNRPIKQGQNPYLAQWENMPNQNDLINTLSGPPNQPSNSLPPSAGKSG